MSETGLKIQAKVGLGVVEVTQAFEIAELEKVIAKAREQNSPTINIQISMPLEDFQLTAAKVVVAVITESQEKRKAAAASKIVVPKFDTNGIKDIRSRGQ